MSGATGQASEPARSSILRSGWFLGEGRFYLDRALEEDGLGRAFAAWDERLQRRVVIRVPAERLLGTAGFRECFEREVRRLAADSPAGVVAALGFGVEESLPYAVLEDPGEDTLATRAAAGGGTLSPDQLVEPLEAAAAALDRLHASGRIHGDVRPESVRLGPEGRVRLSEVAFANALTALGEADGQTEGRRPRKAAQRPRSEAEPNEGGLPQGKAAQRPRSEAPRPKAAEVEGLGRVSRRSLGGLPQGGGAQGSALAFGTPEYAAPERFDGRAEPASDQYSLAATVYGLLSKRRPHEGATPEALATAKREVPPRPVGEVLPELPSVAQRVLMRALSTDPADRFDSCRRFAELFVRGLGAAGVVEEKPRRRFPLLPLFAFALLLALIGWVSLRGPA